MANTVLVAPIGLTGLVGAILKLFDLGGDIVLNGAGDALTERANALGVYTATVTEDITGVKRAIVFNSAGVPIAKGRTEPALANDTGTYQITGDSIAEDNIYHADIQFARDQLNTQDEYTILWFKNGVRVSSGITVPTIQVVKTTDGTDLIASSTPTQIGATGAYKHTTAVVVERQTQGEAVLVLVGATIDGAVRSFARVLGRDSS